MPKSNTPKPSRPGPDPEKAEELDLTPEEQADANAVLEELAKKWATRNKQPPQGEQSTSIKE